MKNRGGVLVLAMLLLIGGLAGCGAGGQVVVDEIGQGGGSDVPVVVDGVPGQPAPDQDGSQNTSAVPTDDDSSERCSSFTIKTAIQSPEGQELLTSLGADPTADIAFSSDGEVKVIWTSSSLVESWQYQVRYVNAASTNFTVIRFEEWKAAWSAELVDPNTYQLTIPVVNADNAEAFVIIQPIATVNDCSQKGVELTLTMGGSPGTYNSQGTIPEGKG